ncbi:hypothetical protein Aab01nite_34570 [Paractinoplanes abujensis]|uniref:Tetratricopeptide repeat protein n=1 Tax=Paractinoplanes abujensis TaxID=882441 RepID=A0A7W7G6J1_9ACTN|nr:hypothetical protein [Actinoplanes abujensis]MBB4697644.1 hypothetical protein [Actinoplanes abujensis]GID19867.1 hypothetical protein Aab01nite_34570 [Actinoplanes abujensis]
MGAIGQFYSLRGSVRLARFRLLHHRPSLDRAISHLERGAARLRPGHPDRPLVLAALSNGLLWRYEQTSAAADLDGAAERLQEAIAAPGLPIGERAGFRGDLAAVLRSRFLRYGDPADLDEAIEAASDAVRHSGNPASAVTNRALALLARYELSADTADLLAALRDAREPARGPLHRGLRLGALISALGARYQYTDDPDDLSGAIAAGREALATLSRFDPYRALYANELSLLLRVTGRPELLTEAVEVAEDALRDDPPDNVDHPGRLSTLSMALFMRHLAGGEPDDLRRARELAEQAAAAGALGRPMLLQRVSLIERRWFDVTGDEAALDRGEQAVREALGLIGPGDPLADALRCELAELLRRRPGDPQRRAEARQLLITAVRGRAPTLSIYSALRAAVALGELAAEDGRAADALLGYRRAVELLPTAAWPGLRRTVREARLAEAPRATDAAATAVQAAQPGLAVELLEAGRAVLWSQQLSRRSDLSRLRVAAPATAERLNEIRGWFERPTAEGE